MRKKGLVSIFVIAGLVFTQCSFAATTQVDSLINKLIEKGILTEKEADQIKGEIVYDEKNIREANMKSDLPQWVQDMKLNGDFRLRHEYSLRNDSTDVQRNRGRIRYRLGIETKINDKVKVAAGLASDGGNPRSNNQSFGSTFAKGNVVLNYAYAEYSPNDYMKLTGGKMKNPIWEPMEFLWDSDITPDGGAIQLNYKLNDYINPFLTAAAFQLSESASITDDPFMYVIQGGIKGKLGEKADYKLVGTWNGLDNVDKNLLANRSSPTTNTTNAASQYVYHYSSPEVGVELGLNDPFGEALPILYVPRVGIFGEYLNNPSPEKQDIAYMFGAYMGNSTVSSAGAWKITGAYKSIARDAWLDALPDSDFYGGATDVKGYESILELGLAKNVSFVIDYYRTERRKTTKAPESLVQTDFNFKF